MPIPSQLIEAYAQMERDKRDRVERAKQIEILENEEGLSKRQAEDTVDRGLGPKVNIRMELRKVVIGNTGYTVILACLDPSEEIWLQ